MRSLERTSIQPRAAILAAEELEQKKGRKTRVNDKMTRAQMTKEIQKHKSPNSREL